VQSGRIVPFALALATLPALLSSASCHGAAESRSPEPPSPSVAAMCPPGAAAARDGCACRSDLRLLLGACVSARTAAEHCGASAVATAEGCSPRPACELGRARDLASGECLARRDVRDLAASLGILVAADDLLGCPPGHELASVIGTPGEGSPRLGCLPRAAPEPLAHSCPAGSLPPACVPVIRARVAGGGSEIDVARWAETAIGPDGGAGAPPLCRAWGRAPAFLGSAMPSDARFVVTLLFRDNDVSQVVAEVRGPDAGAATELDRALGPMIEALRALGGTASQAALSTTVRCVRSAGPRPSSLPAENDHER